MENFKYGDLVINTRDLSVNKVITIKDGVVTFSNRDSAKVENLIPYTPETHKDLTTKNFDIGLTRHVSLTIELDEYYDLDHFRLSNKTALNLVEIKRGESIDVANQVLGIKKIPNNNFLESNDNVFIDTEGIAWLTFSTPREIKLAFQMFHLVKLNLIGGETSLRTIDDALDVLNEGGFEVAYRIGNIY